MNGQLLAPLYMAVGGIVYFIAPILNWDAVMIGLAIGLTNAMLLVSFR